MSAVTAADTSPPSTAYGIDASGAVVTSRAFMVAALMPSVHSLVRALKAIRATGATEDVVGMAIPLEDDPTGGVAIVRGAKEPVKRGFDLGEFLATAIDPHRPTTLPWRLGPGRNIGVATEVLGDITRWMVGIQTFRIPLAPPGEEGDRLWVLARPNHAAAIHKVPGDATEGYVGMLASFGVPADFSRELAGELAAGQCIITTCETEEGRRRRDERLIRKAGATIVHPFEPAPVIYGVRPA